MHFFVFLIYIENKSEKLGLILINNTIKI